MDNTIMKTSSSTVYSTSSALNKTMLHSIGTQTPTKFMAVQGAAIINPILGGVFVGITHAAIYGISNAMKYKKKKITGTEAIKSTAKDSAGLTISAVLGLTAANAVTGTAIAFGSTLYVPVSVAVAGTFITKKVWNKIFNKNQCATCLENRRQHPRP